MLAKFAGKESMELLNIRTDEHNPRRNLITTSGGRPLLVKEAHLSFQPEGVAEAVLTVYGFTFDIQGTSSFVVLHPVTGEPKKVKSIAFEDGSIWSGELAPQ